MKVDQVKLMKFMDELKNVFPAHSHFVEPEAVLPKSTKLDELFKAIRLNCTERAQNTLEKFRKLDPQNPIFVCGNLGAGNPLRSELAHTKTLAWLFDKNQRHGFGDSLMVSFLRTLDSGNKNKEMKLQVKRVVSEKFTSCGRRIDIWADGCFADQEDKRKIPWLLVIEAKVDAPERDDQLPSYDEEIAKWKKMNPRSIVWKVFLTPDRRKSRVSNWMALSYEDVVKALWKGVCNAVHGSKNELPGLSMARCYLACVLSDIVGMPLPFGKNIGNPYTTLSYLEGEAL